MRKSLSLFLISTSCLLSLPLAQANPAAANPTPKEWTFLIYLNGDNSLDSFGPMNIESMEKVGSTDQLNIVVQWASLQNKKTQRLLVTKSTNPNAVTSPILQDMGVVDMGNYQTLADFIQWGVQNYPANHYFIDVWDHGSGWHNTPGPMMAAQTMSPMDISWDDNTGHFITTQQLGQVIQQAAQLIGHKVDIYGSDACMMGMAEVAAEMKDSVDYFAGSQETEPGAGWPYDKLLAPWAANPQMAASDIAKTLVTEYVKAYENGGEYDPSSATFSALDMSQFAGFETAIKSLATNLEGFDATNRAAIVNAIAGTQVFTDTDYGDLMNFVGNAQSAVTSISSDSMAQVKTAFNNLVISNADTSDYSNAHGLSVWLPGAKSVYQSYSAAYTSMQFNVDTGWGNALQYLLQDSTN